MIQVITSLIRGLVLRVEFWRDRLRRENQRLAASLISPLGKSLKPHRKRPGRKAAVLNKQRRLIGKNATLLRQLIWADRARSGLVHAVHRAVAKPSRRMRRCVHRSAAA